jgi:hypothetical protein
MIHQGGGGSGEYATDAWVMLEYVDEWSMTELGLFESEDI